MTYVGLGLGIAPVLLILLLGHRVLIDALLGLCRWKGLLARMLRGGLSLFTGQMLASAVGRSEEHTSELQSLMRSTSPVFCWINNIGYNGQYNINREIIPMD